MRVIQFVDSFDPNDPTQEEVEVSPDDPLAQDLSEEKPKP